MSRDTSKKASPDASSTYRLSAAKWTLILLFGPSVRRDPSFRTKLRVSAIPVAASKSARVRFGMINTAAAVEEAIAAKADNRGLDDIFSPQDLRMARLLFPGFGDLGSSKAKDLADAAPEMMSELSPTAFA